MLSRSQVPVASGVWCGVRHGIENGKSKRGHRQAATGRKRRHRAEILRRATIAGLVQQEKLVKAAGARIDKHA